MNGSSIGNMQEPFSHFSTPASCDEFQQYMKNNIPCTFGSWISSSWPASHDWAIENKPNFRHLGRKFGTFKASVSKFIDETSFVCNETLIGDFLCYWEDLMNGNLICSNFPRCHDMKNLPSYMKDWHFAKDCNAKELFSLPEGFEDDWLNQFWDVRHDSNDDYRFAYFGPAGSFTPFHADVFRSYSWSVNICGRKKWLILYPGEELKLISEFNVEDQCMELGLKYKILEQNTGEGIFIPSGWFHQVLNMEDTISLNHNWCNIYCAPLMWNYLTSEYELVEKEIMDCREMMNDKEWSDQCQLILKSNLGIDYRDFLWMLFYVISTRGIIFRDELIRLVRNVFDRDYIDVIESYLKIEQRKLPTCEMLCGNSGITNIELYVSLLDCILQDKNCFQLITTCHKT